MLKCNWILVNDICGTRDIFLGGKPDGMSNWLSVKVLVTKQWYFMHKWNNWW
jgi:hypothetical protein